ncbi:ZIP family metal transporter [Nonomuraea sp. NPDC050556]|uniref:ZIP family metal transporter n=1 Tax=Nonomuraea sp. NPDC050556 TaxID=3364369 RepID=UPI0037A0E921
MLWGFVGGATLVVGALIAWLVDVPRRAIGWVMAFGAGVLTSALAFDLMDEAERKGGLWPTAAGFTVGAVLYLAANAYLATRGARHRKRSGAQQPSETQAPGSGAAIAVGALLDGIPESVVLGLSVAHGGTVGLSMIAAVAISNLPEGMSSAAGMKQAGRSARYVFTVWIAIALACGLSALLGALALQAAPPEVVALITAVAAGAILTMIADTMIPEAFEDAGQLTGLLTAAGFLMAFALERIA